MYAKRCASCHSELPEGAPGNRCPTCLLGLGLAGEDRAPDPEPERIGRYKLLQQIGEGGCGIVYLAKQEEPVRRRVALKVIKLGMDTKSVVARFEAERQALAMMDHPNIAHVFDGGATEQGRPFFVMELVRGIKITDYCDQHQLSMPERLELFVQVCQAVQHAHQKGIIHRDLKPSNILVTVNDGVALPKVIDFGVAKATEQRLTDKTIFTAVNAFIGTPAYMSPEQAEMSSLDIDTRSDIYSLGVLLYEMLTGQTPFDHRDLVQSGVDELRRTIREKEPLRPSTRLRALANETLIAAAKHRRVEAPRLISVLRGDLDWIVMKCLEKDRTRRYGTANGLATDIQRYLSNEPVVARPPNTLYRLRKAMRRNKLVFATGATVVLSLVAVFIVGTVSYARERAARADADQRRKETEAARAGEAAQRRVAEANALQARRSLYAADMLLAQQALDENNWGQVRARLKAHLPRPAEPDLRGWEWRYLWGQSRSEALFELGRHDNTVFGLAASGDGRFLASLGYDQTVRLFEIGSRRELGRFRATHDHPLPTVRDELPAIEFSPRGDLLGISGLRSGVTFLSIPSLQPIHETALAGTSAVLSFRFEAGGRECLVVTSGQILRYDIGARTVLGAEMAPLAKVAGLSRNGRYLLFGGSDDRRVSVWDRQRKSELASWNQEPWWGQAIAFSADGRWAAVGGQTEGEKGVIVLFDLIDHREQWRVEGLGTWVSGVNFAPDSKTVAASSTDHLVRLWNIEASNEVKRLRGHQDEPWPVAFAIDGETLFVGEKQGALTAWSTRPESGHASRHAMWPDSLWRLISRNGETVLTVSSNGWAEVSSLVCDRPAIRFDLQGTNLSSIDISVDGCVLAVGRSTGQTEIWEAASGVRLKDMQWKAPYRIRRLALSEDTRRLAGILGAGVALWDTQTGKMVFQTDLSFRAPAVLTLARDAQRLAIGSFEGEVEVWDVANRDRLLFAVPHKHELRSLAFSPDGKHLASVGIDARLKILEVITGRVLASLEAHRNTLDSIAYSQDGARLVAAGPNGEIYLFETDQFQPVGRLKVDGHSPCTAWLAPENNNLILSEATGFQILSVPPLNEIDASETLDKPAH